MTYGLGRVEQFDARSLDYPVSSMLVGLEPRNYDWPNSLHLNQGGDPSCVGFCWEHELAGLPVAIPNCNAPRALARYYAAQRIDEWPGEGYPGTSVLAGAKMVVSEGFMSEYRWAFSFDDLLLAVGHQGPAVMGTKWWNSMFAPDGEGIVRINTASGNAGGHCWKVKGVQLERELFRCHNSWGESWGKGGDFFVPFDVMRQLQAEGGEACIPVKRLGPIDPPPPTPPGPIDPNSITQAQLDALIIAKMGPLVGFNVNFEKGIVWAGRVKKPGE